MPACLVPTSPACHLAWSDLLWSDLLWSGLQCNSKHQCYTCWPSSSGQDDCEPIIDYQRLVVEEHGNVKGREAMKAEIFARGTISCGIDATDAMDSLKVNPA